MSLHHSTLHYYLGSFDCRAGATLANSSSNFVPQCEHLTEQGWRADIFNALKIVSHPVSPPLPLPSHYLLFQFACQHACT